VNIINLYEIPILSSGELNKIIGENITKILKSYNPNEGKVNIKLNTYGNRGKNRGEIKSEIKKSLNEYIEHLKIAKRGSIYQFGFLIAMESLAYASLSVPLFLYTSPAFPATFQYLLGLANSVGFWGIFVFFPLLKFLLIKTIGYFRTYKKFLNKAERLIGEIDNSVVEEYNDELMVNIHKIFEENYKRDKSPEVIAELILEYIKKLPSTENIKVVKGEFEKFTSDSIYNMRGNLIKSIIGMGGIKERLKKALSFKYSYGLENRRIIDMYVVK